MAMTRRELEKNLLLNYLAEERTVSDKLISVVIPVYNTEPVFLCDLIDSISNQIYKNFEVVICNDASTDTRTLAILERVRQHPKVKVITHKHNKGVAAATKTALKCVSGDYVCFVDHDDLLLATALSDVAEYFNAREDIDICYTDELMINADEVLMNYTVKPEFDIDLLRQYQYCNHLLAVRRKVIEVTPDTFQSWTDGSQDYDFLLKAYDAGFKIGHLPRFAYFWRRHDKTLSTQSLEATAVANIRAMKAINDHFSRKGIDAYVSGSTYPGVYKIDRPIKGCPMVSVIICTKNNGGRLAECINAIWRNAGWDNYEVIIVDTGATEKNTLKWLKDAVEYGHQNLRVVKSNKPDFNYSRENNFGAGFANGNYLLFLNDDTTPQPNWMLEMLMECQRPGVGVVGSKLLFRGNEGYAGTIQHAGIVIDHRDGMPHHIFGNFAEHDPVTNIARDYLAVTGASLMIKKDLFDAIKGFDTDYWVEFQDVDICFKVKAAGYRVRYTPYSVAYHDEGGTRGRTVSAEIREHDAGLLLNRWGKQTDDMYLWRDRAYGLLDLRGVKANVR